MNAVIIGIFSMLALSMARMNVVLSVFMGAMIAGLAGGMGLSDTLNAFTEGLGGGASIAMSYALLGAFAAALAHSEVPSRLAGAVAERLKGNSHSESNKGKLCLLMGILLMAIASQNIIPVHIAFIPILIPPLLATFNKLQLDRRAVACVLIFGLCGTYLIVPFGFGNIYLNQILAGNLAANGVTIEHKLLPLAMAMPVLGMLTGMLWAVFVTYRRPRLYQYSEIKTTASKTGPKNEAIGKYTTVIVGMAIVVALIIQILTASILLGSMSGFMLLVVVGLVPWKQADSVFVDGIKMMAFAGFVMMAASGFSEVLRQSGDIPVLVHGVTSLLAGNKALAAFMMLAVGLLITLGIGSSFSTIPIIAAIFVPLAAELGFSPMAIAALVGAGGALGDAASPVSESTIGPTMGLSPDGQHDHIRDTVLPALLHFNIPMMAFGWVAAMIL